MRALLNNFCPPRTSLSLNLALVFAACLLGGCAAIGPATRPGTAALNTGLSPLDYYAWATTASENELLVELYGLELTIAAADPLIAAVRKSIILSSSELADAQTQLQAHLILSGLTEVKAIDDSGRAYKIFAEVLLALQQQREELRTSGTANQRALREIDALKSRNSALQQQIEELTSIERQIIEREQLNTQER